MVGTGEIDQSSGHQNRASSNFNQDLAPIAKSNADAHEYAMCGMFSPASFSQQDEDSAGSAAAAIVLISRENSITTTASSGTTSLPKRKQDLGDVIQAAAAASARDESDATAARQRYRQDTNTTSDANYASADSFKDEKTLRDEEEMCRVSAAALLGLGSSLVNDLGSSNIRSTQDESDTDDRDNAPRTRSSKRKVDTRANPGGSSSNRHYRKRTVAALPTKKRSSSNLSSSSSIASNPTSPRANGASGRKKKRHVTWDRTPEKHRRTTKLNPKDNIAVLESQSDADMDGDHGAGSSSDVDANEYEYEQGHKGKKQLVSVSAETSLVATKTKRADNADITLAAKRFKQAKNKTRATRNGFATQGSSSTARTMAGPTVQVNRGKIKFEWEYQIDSQGFLQSNEDTEAAIAGIVRKTDNSDNNDTPIVDLSREGNGINPAILDPNVSYKQLVLNGAEVARLHRRKRRLKAETSIHAGTSILSSVVMDESTTQVVDGFIAVDDSQDRKSLGLLARSCLDALERLGPISMTRLTTELRMVKRRIYDVSNILEGVGIIEKGSRNMVRLTRDGLALVRHQRTLQREDHTMSEMHDFKRHWKSIGGPKLNGELTLARDSDWFTPDATQIVPLRREPFDDDGKPVCGYGWYGRTSYGVSLAKRMRSGSGGGRSADENCSAAAAAKVAAAASAVTAARSADVAEAAAFEAANAASSSWFLGGGGSDTHVVNHIHTNDNSSIGSSSSEHGGLDEHGEGPERVPIIRAPLIYRNGIPLSSTAVTSSIDLYTDISGPEDPDIALHHIPKHKKVLKMTKTELQAALDKEIVMAEFLHDMDAHMDTAIEFAAKHTCNKSSHQYIAPQDMHYLMDTQAGNPQLLLQAPASAQISMFRERQSTVFDSSLRHVGNGSSGASSSSGGHHASTSNIVTSKEPLEKASNNNNNNNNGNMLPPDCNDAQTMFESYRPCSRVERVNYAGFDSLFAIAPSPMSFYVLDPNTKAKATSDAMSKDGEGKKKPQGSEKSATGKKKSTSRGDRDSEFFRTCGPSQPNGRITKISGSVSAMKSKMIAAVTNSPRPMATSSADSNQAKGNKRKRGTKSDVPSTTPSQLKTVGAGVVAKKVKTPVIKSNTPVKVTPKAVTVSKQIKTTVQGASSRKVGKVNGRSAVGGPLASIRMSTVGGGTNNIGQVVRRPTVASNTQHSLAASSAASSSYNNAYKQQLSFRSPGVPVSDASHLKAFQQAMMSIQSKGGAKLDAKTIDAAAAAAAAALGMSQAQALAAHQSYKSNMRTARVEEQIREAEELRMTNVLADREAQLRRAEEVHVANLHAKQEEEDRKVQEMMHKMMDDKQDKKKKIKKKKSTLNQVFPQFHPGFSTASGLFPTGSIPPLRTFPQHTKPNTISSSNVDRSQIVTAQGAVQGQSSAVVVSTGAGGVRK